jgi:tRNA-dihydrouridine synthase
MQDPQVQEVYRQRAATSETVHADLRAHRGLKQFPVRGLESMQAVALLMAVTYNALRIIANGWM